MKKRIESIRIIKDKNAMKLETLDNGLLVDSEKSQYLGFIIDCNGKGSYTPNGKTPEELTPEQIKRHNEALASIEWQRLKETGKGILYLTTIEESLVSSNCGKNRFSGKYKVSDFTSSHSINVAIVTKSFHNLAGRNGRTDLHFCLDGSVWHGVLIGDSQLLRVKRTKSRID
jgi:hypothetical protein